MGTPSSWTHSRQVTIYPYIARPLNSCGISSYIREVLRMHLSPSQKCVLEQTLLRAEPTDTEGTETCPAANPSDCTVGYALDIGAS